MQVVVAGATGLVGSACVRQLLAAPWVARVTALVRREWPGAPRDARLEVRRVDYAELPGAAVAGADAVICALGTTMRQARSREAFARVDHDHPVALARAARAGGVRHYLLVSALGADAGSRVFYNRVKGEAERDVAAEGPAAITIVRPSLLLGQRTETRPAEVLFGVVAAIAPERWRAVHATQVAAALVDAVHRRPDGTETLDNPALRRFPRGD